MTNDRSLMVLEAPTFCRRTMPSVRVSTLTLLRTCVESNLCSCSKNSKWHSKHHRPQNCFWWNLDVTSLH